MMPTTRSTLLSLLSLAALACNAPTGNDLGEGGGGAAATGAPTWAEDVAPIVMKSCAGCHVKDGIAPFALQTYEEARPLAGAIKAATAARTMPPWNLDNTGSCNTYSDARWLTDAEIATLGAWADANAPEGDPEKAPPPPGPPAALTGKSTTLDMGVTYTPDSNVDDEYRCFVVNPGLTQDRFLTGYQVHPGEQRVVHHLILFAVDTAAGEQQAEALDAADPKDGYLCYGGAGVPSARFVAGWAPGSGATYFPEGTGIRLAANRKLVMQVHYNLANGAHPDRTTVDLALVESVSKEATIARIAANGFMLPPGQALTSVTGNLPIPAAKGQVTLWGVGPHMHARGRTQDAWYELDGQKTCLSKVNDWNFHWQGFARLAKPITVQAGGTLGVTCGFDTSKDTMPIKSGEATTDEMCIDFLYVTE